tara:strand:- start:47 stop:337 length:291 start_codon:yes stop_codon:yes gene_type:complete
MEFLKYYEYYLTLHQNVWNRRLHVIGQLFTLLHIYLCLTIFPVYAILLAPFIIYPFAWTGHFVFEKNKPAAFKNPLYAKLSDWIMLKDWFLGKIER